MVSYKLFRSIINLSSELQSFFQIRKISLMCYNYYKNCLIFFRVYNISSSTPPHPPFQSEDFSYHLGDTLILLLLFALIRTIKCHLKSICGMDIRSVIFFVMMRYLNNIIFYALMQLHIIELSRWAKFHWIHQEMLSIFIQTEVLWSFCAWIGCVDIRTNLHTIINVTHIGLAA